jgi:UDP-N-acetyl-D-glucosamine dehydrogenase
VGDDRTVISIKRVDYSEAEIAAADAVILLTDHDAFDLSILSAAQFVLDTRNQAPAGPSVQRL